MRQQTRFDPSVKNFEAFLDYSGGRNSEVSNERLKENEYPDMQNCDLSGRGSSRTRYGRTQLLQITGSAQGMFWYYRNNVDSPDLILAINGRLYRHNGGSSYTEIPITNSGSPFTFQTTQIVEAVQYRGVLFVATGTKLVEVHYNEGTNTYSAEVAAPYTPSVMEVIYIGTNGLADDPDTYIQDGTGTLAVLGIKPEFRYGTKNNALDFTAYIQKPSGAGTLDYKWEYKDTDDTTWTQISDWTLNKKTVSHSFTSEGSFDVKVSIRETATPATVAGYTLTSFEVKPVDDRLDDANMDTIQLCRRIMVHWDRLILYGDDDQPNQMYISDLENPRYFPVPNTITFDFGKREDITDVVRFQDMLVVFTPTTIQTLTGKSPEDYNRFLINDNVGCMTRWTAKVVGNFIIFKSYEGIMRLRPNPYRLESMNVDRVDLQIKSEVPLTGDASAVVMDDQYWICFPDQSVIFRYYYLQNAWVKDVSSKLNITQFLSYGKEVYNFTKTGVLMKHDRDVYTDCGEEYTLATESKYLDLGATFNNKKLKRMYVLGRHFGHTTDVYATVWADSAITLNPESGQAVVLGTGEVVWQTTLEPNFQFFSGTAFGSWLMGVSPWGNQTLSVQRASVRGKCRRVKVRIEVTSSQVAEIYGFGLEFKLKKI